MSQLQHSLVAFLFSLPDVLIATDAMSNHWDFYFPSSGLPVSCCGMWYGSKHEVHITLQELQTVAFILHKMAFQLSNQVVALYLDNSTAKTYSCN